MKKVLIICCLVTIFTTAVVAGFFYYKNFVADSPTPVLDTINPAEKRDDNTATVAPVNDESSSVAIKQNTNVTETKESSVVPPMDNFLGRITLNKFGNEPSKMELPKEAYSDLSCSGGKNYAGFHTANDLEVTPAERDKPVPIYSIANGIVRQSSIVSGYGGLVVIEHEISGITYTVYYGHVDLSTVNIKSGSKVTVGQKIANLAPGCSAANGNTRKHLHFGMRKGKAVVVSGYVTSKSSLSNWVDARSIIK